MILLIPAMIVAGGNPEVGLPKVDRLIKERNYNAAILELAQYMTENPKDFDGAQQRVRRIMNMRENYNDEAHSLLETLVQEPLNDQKKLDKIANLETLEKNPNEATQEFITETKAAAQFTYYRAKFDDIMTRGNRLIDEGRYVEAARTFTEGYSFYKNEFDEASDPNLVATVNSRLGAIMNALSAHSARQTSFVASSEAVRTEIAAGNPSGATAAYTVFAAELDGYSEERNRVAGNGWFFEDTFKQQNPGEETTDNSFLPFAQRFTMGRKTADRFEGVLGALDAQWNVAMDGMNSALDDTIGRYWNEAYEGIGADAVESATASLDRAAQFASLGATMPTAARGFSYRGDMYGARDTNGTVLRYRSLGSLVGGMKSLARVWDEYYAVSGRAATVPPETPSAELLRTGRTVTVRVNTGYVGEYQAISRRLDEVSRPVAALPVIPGYTEGFNKRRDELAALLAERQINLYRASSSHQERSATLMEGDWRSEYESGGGYLNGTIAPPGGETSTPERTVYYPAEALAAYNRVRAGVAADRRVLQNLLTAMGQVPQYVRQDQEYARNVESVRASLARLDALDAEAASGITQANSRILQANLAKQESDLRYLQSQAALKRGDFQGARDNLERARERINKSLEWQESATLRKESDARLAGLGAEITRIENEAVIREVRALISSGRNFYYLGNFDQAEQVFTQAKTRWSATNVDENAEVTNWLNIVNTALSMKTGRSIPVSAPLYPQMSQILSSAGQLYGEGKVLLASGNRAEAIRVFVQAKEKLQQLQLVYPLNQDAGQLTLRIDQLIDAAAFKLFFSQKVEYIRANYRTERQTAYGDLLDLYEIDPNYPGLKRLLDEVEIYLGVKIPPPDPAAVQRSTELTRSARRIFDANTRSMFQVALDQLDEAIRLNPDNQQAVALIDRVRTSMGGQSVAVLSAADEAKYQTAVQELQKGNKITASALVEQLMQNPRSRNSSKIIDLKKRIDSQL